MLHAHVAGHHHGAWLCLHRHDVLLLVDGLIGCACHAVMVASVCMTSCQKGLAFRPRHGLIEVLRVEVVEHLHLPRLGRQAHLAAALVLVLLEGRAIVLRIQLDGWQGLRCCTLVILPSVIHCETRCCRLFIRGTSATVGDPLLHEASICLVCAHRCRTFHLIV